MKYILCAFGLCCLLASNVHADPIVLIPTGGQLSWTHFQGPASDVASLTLTAVGFSAVATNQEAIGKQWGGLCPINCTGSTSVSGSFSWNAGTDGVTVTGQFNIFPNGSIPPPPGSPFPPPIFTFVFTATGTLVEDTATRFLFVFNDQTAVPEPVSIVLVGLGLIGVGGATLRRTIVARNS